LIVDPIVSAINGDSHKNSEVRNVGARLKLPSIAR
jgi:hypothetical protein